LHGHNYTLGVRMLGSHQINHDGYVLDFGDVKKIVKIVCKRMNERFLCPTKSDVVDLQIVPSENNSDKDSKSVVLTCEDESRFVIPCKDCFMIPIVHVTVEELAMYCWGEIYNGLDGNLLRRRGIHTMEVVCAEAPGQEAVFRYELPEIKSEKSNEEKIEFDVPSIIMKESRLAPTPCLEREENEVEETKLQESDKADNGETKRPSRDCNGSDFSKQLEELASAINKTRNSKYVSVDDLRSILEKNGIY